MGIIENSVEIRCPVDEVFAYTTVADKWPEWQSFIKRAEPTSEVWGVGFTSRGVVHMMGLDLKWTAKVRESEPERRWTKDITSGGITIAEQVTCEPTENGTKFSIAYDIRAGGLMKLFTPMIVRTMRRETAQSLSVLKSILEAPAATAAR